MEMIVHLRNIQPDAVFTWFLYPRFTVSPSAFGDLGFHPDHQHVGRLTLDVAFAAGVARMWPDIAPAWTGLRYFFMFCFTQVMY